MSLTIAMGITDPLTDKLELVDLTDMYTGEQDLLVADMQEALVYVSRRIDIKPQQPVRVLIDRDANCELNGATYSLVHIIYIASCDHVPRRRVVNVTAHELVHQLAQERYGRQHLEADIILMEGFATWGAGRYWLGNRSSFHEFAREYRATGYDFPLATHYHSAGTIDAMNALYYQWASFVDYLIAIYGREHFDALYISGIDGKPGSARYAEIYGHDLKMLESKWLEYLNQ